MLFHFTESTPIRITDDRGSGAWNDFTCYKPDNTGSGRYTVGHFGINANYRGNKPVVYQVSATRQGAKRVFKEPERFRRIWKDSGSGGTYDWSVWEVVCSIGYGALSDVCQIGYNSPSTSTIMCIKDKYLENEYRDRWLWHDKGSGVYADVDINGGSSTRTQNLVTATNQRGSKRTLHAIKSQYFGNNRFFSNVNIIKYSIFQDNTEYMESIIFFFFSG